MRIILAEDHESVRNSLADFLSETHHEVRACANGEEALAQVKAWPAQVILSDIQMPRLDGLSLLKAVKADPATRDVEVILFTGFGDVKGAVEAIRMGAYDYLLKPVNIRELDIQLRRLAEFLTLKKEHGDLSRHFEERVSEATGEMVRQMAQLQEALAREVGAGGMGVFSEKMRQVHDQALRLHQNPDIPVLIEGETGTGKEMLARFIHYGQGQVTTPFVAVNCAALSANLFESELFGYEAGAFTGANSKGQKGKLELADEGTLFLDEITEMPVEHQAKLLRVIQEREYYRVGGLKLQPVKARIICSTNQPVDRMIDEGAFRQDLFYRLSVGHLRIPPLRERREAIVPLARLFLDDLQRRKGSRFREIHFEAVAMMEAYAWPGNVRELKNALDRIALYWNDPVLEVRHLEETLPRSAAAPPRLTHEVPVQTAPPTGLPQGVDLDTHILSIVDEALALHQGNQTKTAQYLGISVRRLHTHLRHLESRG